MNKSRDQQFSGLKVGDVIEGDNFAWTIIELAPRDGESARAPSASCSDNCSSLSDPRLILGAESCVGDGGDDGLASDDEAVFVHRALLINVNRSSSDWSLYDATRYAWKIDRRKAAEADVILAIKSGYIIGAFVAHEWLEATVANFPGRAEGIGAPGRYGFIGEEAPEAIERLYIGKAVPFIYRKKGARNPVRYTWAH